MKQEGDKSYPDATKRKAMQLWASGVFSNDAQIAAKVGVKRAVTISDWRQAGVPDDWHAFRAKTEERTLEKSADKLAETLSEVRVRQLKEVRRLKEQLEAEMLISEPGKTDAMARAFVALQDKEVELAGGNRQTVGLRIDDMTEDELDEYIAERMEEELQPTDEAGDSAEAEAAGGEAEAREPDDTGVPEQ